MDKKIVGVAIGVAVVIAIASGVLSISSDSSPKIIPQKTNDKIGLVINSPNQSVTLQELDEIYSTASESGIGRSNVYLFWNLIEPEHREYNWQYSDALMSFNQKNELKVTLYFSIINGETLGPFPDWIGKPPIQSLNEDRVVSVLDAILSRYHIVDTVILAEKQNLSSDTMNKTLLHTKNYSLEFMIKSKKNTLMKKLETHLHTPSFE